MRLPLGPGQWPVSLEKVGRGRVSLGGGVWGRFWGVAQQWPIKGLLKAQGAAKKGTTTGKYDRPSPLASKVLKNQFKNAPVAGMMMNALIDYVEAGNDHDKKPLQFKLPNVDYDLDMSFCSRKREINRESSFSVVG